MTVISYLEHYTHGAFSPFVREVRTGSGLSMLEVVQPAGDFPDPPVPELVLLKAHNAFRYRADHGAGRFRGTSCAGDFFLAPPLTSTDVRMDDPSRLRMLALPTALLADAADGWISDLAALYAQSFRSEWLEGLFDRLWFEAALDNPGGRLCSDTLNLLVLRELARLAEQRPAAITGGLAAWQVRRSTEYILAHLDENVSLAEVAATVRLSPFHFARAFKRSVGLPPHAWQQQQRVERAKELLLRPELSVLEVAAMVGYENPGHFAKLFRRLSGVSPREFRRGTRADLLPPG